MERAMKDSGVEWIGKIPDKWEKAKMKQVGRYINGYAFKPEDWSSQGKPIIRIQDLTGSNRNPNYFDGDIDKKYLIKQGDILVSWAATLDAFIWKGNEGWLNQHIFKAIPDEKIIQYDFFFWLMKIAMENMNNDNKHGIVMQHVTTEVFGNFGIPMPPLNEQQRIAEFLDDKVDEIDRIILKTKASVDEYKKYRKSIVIKAVTKGLYPDVPMKQTDSDWIGEIPAHWDYVRIQRLFETVDERNDDENAILLSLYTALGVKPRNELEEKGNKASTVINYKKVQKNDVIVNKLLAWMGAIGYSDYEGVTSPDYDVYRAREGANVVRNYYNEYFRNTCFNGDCYKYGHGIMLMRWRTYPEELLRIKVPNPPLEEQQEIADYLAEKCGEIDSLIAKKEAFVEEMETYKKSLIYEYVTGKKEV